MPPSKEDTRRLCAIELDEETGEVGLYLPSYEKDEQVTFATLLFMAMASKLTVDEEWCNALVAEAEDAAQVATKH